MAKERGKGELYEEVKISPIFFMLTPTGARLLRQKLEEYREQVGEPISLAEFFERYARGIL